ncbi:MAG TPA: DUF1598 domain-containing protein [Pirellulales bacterium]|nr:DUF1598 domain-containing protein [Pirellulales bacterium]
METRMNHRRGSLPWQSLCTIGLVVGCLAAVAVAGAPSGGKADAEQLLAEQLAAGEFAPAFEQARDADDAAARDLRLKQIARAQALAGERSASLTTIGAIRDDVSRDSSLAEITGEQSNYQPPSDQPPSGESTDRGAPRGARGGGGQANFGELIELITSTIKPDSWDDTGGPGTIRQYNNGVYVDPAGVVRPVTDADGGGRLAEFRRAARRAVDTSDARRASPLRKVSLNRLEREVQLRLAAGRGLDDEMFVLGGLQRIEYVLAYPETGDIVLAGPAGDWKLDRENRIVSAETGRPVLQLDDLVVLLRHFNADGGGEFGCSIDPTEEGLAKAHAFLKESSTKPLKPGQRGKWLEQVRSQIGLQNIRVSKIDPHSRVAQVIVEADYRMKLVGIGLEEGTADVPSYLQMIKLAAGQSPPPMDVLRWWFTVNYDAVLTSPDRDVFEIRGQGVKVLGENEMLTAEGKQIHTGQADELNAEFAHRFTKHFAALAAKYPIYAELQNVFDLALVASLVRSEGLADRVGWHMLTFGSPGRYAAARLPVAKTVDTVMNHRLFNGGKQIVAVVSGGVSADFHELTDRQAIETDARGSLSTERSRSRPAVPDRAWWWD